MWQLQTVDRLKPVLPPERLWILTSPALRAEIVRQLPEVPRAQILAEPAQPRRRVFSALEHLVLEQGRGKGGELRTVRIDHGQRGTKRLVGELADLGIVAAKSRLGRPVGESR